MSVAQLRSIGKKETPMELTNYTCLSARRREGGLIFETTYQISLSDGTFAHIYTHFDRLPDEYHQANEKEELTDEFVESLVHDWNIRGPTTRSDTDVIKALNASGVFGGIKAVTEKEWYKRLQADRLAKGGPPQSGEYTLKMKNYSISNSDHNASLRENVSQLTALPPKTLNNLHKEIFFAIYHQCQSGLRTDRYNSHVFVEPPEIK